MSSVPREDAAARRRARRLSTAIKDSLRELSIQLSLLNHQVGARLELRDVDFDCLDVINRYGPLSPGVLARRAGLHPATMTGILDRLERGGWVVRERDAADRRAVHVRALRDRTGEVIRLFAGMNGAMDDVCADYTDEQLELIAGFLDKATAGGRQATEGLVSGGEP
jgi:DNA-binding MarR family transcriptional regulator